MIKLNQFFLDIQITLLFVIIHYVWFLQLLFPYVFANSVTRVILCYGNVVYPSWVCSWYWNTNSDINLDQMENI